MPSEPPDDEAASIHKLSPEEERQWKQVKDQRNTREDWEDLNATIVAHKRRRIARADASPAQDPIAAAVDAQLEPLKDELTAFGHQLVKDWDLRGL